MQADINCGNYDTSWVKFTTLQPQNLHVIPMDKSDISANDKQMTVLTAGFEKVNQAAFGNCEPVS